MAGRAYNYQYETSPRKLSPEYTKPKKKTTTKTNKTKKTQTAKKKKDSAKEKLKLERKLKFNLFVKCLLLFAILFFIIFRNSQISESFSQIQALKSQITALQKENDQLEISIQNSLNSNNIEQQAKELLGMQKLTNKQTVYINLDKKDYVEPSAEKVIMNENEGFFGKIINKIKNLF